MFAVDLGDVVRELDRRGHFVRGQKRVAAQSLQTVDSESGKSAIQSLLRNAKNAIRSRDVGQIIGLRRNARSVQVIQAGADNVDQSGRKRMRKSKRTLLGMRCLRTLLETAAAVTGRVVAGSKMVPVGTVRPSASFCVPL